MRALCTLALAFSLAGCGGPFLAVPGGELSGEVVETKVDDWTFVDSTFLDVETRPDDPYSVELNYVLREGALYLDPAEGRTWLDHIRADPNVRVRVDNRVYNATAILVGKPGELPEFPEDRFIYRLDPR